MASIRISQFKHRVAVCSLNDVVTADGEMRLARDDVYHAWARIEPKKTSNFSREGYAIDDGKNRQSHLITMRMRLDIDISASAWIYEERLQSANRWYRVLGVTDMADDGDYIVLSCKLVERADNTTAPIDPDSSSPSLTIPHALPNGVRL